MLDQSKLKKDFYDCLHSAVPKAFKQAFLEIYPNTESKEANDITDQIAETVDEIISEPIADAFSQAIDTYIKAGQLKGMLMSVGPPISGMYMCNLVPMAMGMPTAGSVPNTIGIQ